MILPRQGLVVVFGVVLAVKTTSAFSPPSKPLFVQQDHIRPLFAKTTSSLHLYVEENDFATPPGEYFDISWLGSQVQHSSNLI